MLMKCASLSLFWFRIGSHLVWYCFHWNPLSRHITSLCLNDTNYSARCSASAMFDTALCCRFLNFIVKISSIEFIADDISEIVICYHTWWPSSTLLHEGWNTFTYEIHDFIGEGYCHYWTILTNLSRHYPPFITIVFLYCIHFFDNMAHSYIAKGSLYQMTPRDTQSCGAVLGLVMPAGWISPVHGINTSCERKKAELQKQQNSDLYS